MTARETQETQPAEAPPKPVGIRDVAKMAGVSVASASLALNGQPGVAEDHAPRVSPLPRSNLGYRANPQAQALRRGRSTIYGFVVRNFANPFFLDVMSGAEQVAGEAGATLLVLDSQYSLDREAEHMQEDGGAAPGRAGDRPGRGGRLDPALAASCGPARPSSRSTPRWPASPALSRVSPGQRRGRRAAMRRLAELGHASVAFLSAPRGLMADPDRLRHFRRRRAGLGLRAAWCTRR